MAIPVIVVDPDEEYRELTVKTLESTGQFKASSATSAIEAAQLLKGSKVQIAIVDMDVAQDQGEGYLRKIREDNRHLLLIAIVGNREVHTSLLEDLGVAAVIEKPYFLPELPSIIQNVINPPTTKPPPNIGSDLGSEQVFDEFPEPENSASKVDHQQLGFDPPRQPGPNEVIEGNDAQIGIDLFQADPAEPSADILSALEPTADIDLESAEANELEIDREDAAIRSPTSDAMRIESTPDPPRWLDDRTYAAEYLTRLFQEHSAHGLILLRDGELWAWSQRFSEDRARSVVHSLHEHEFKAEKQESIFRYIRFEGDEDDFLLYAIPVISTYTLVLLYEADKPFSLARRQAKFLSRLLSNPEPSKLPLADPIPTIEDREIPERPDQLAGLPGDWVPLSPASDVGISILGDLDVPPPDPEPEIKEDQESTASSEFIFPSDWHPKRPMPAAHLPFLDVDASDSSSHSESQHSAADGNHNLSFTAILLPHFPEHQLNESMSAKISEWTRKLCLAWGWKAEIIEVLPDHMRLTLILSQDIAPGQAIKQISIDTSTRLIEAYPQQFSNLPSGQFWSDRYFLSSGKEITSDQLQLFMKAARKA